MNAPDKIYYHKGALRTPFAMEKRTDETDIEYIRKDTILHYLNKRISTKKTLLEYGVVRAIIGKIESM